MVGRLQLGQRDVAAGPVKTLRVPPGHPGGGREFDLVSRPPGALGADEFGPVETVDRLGDGVGVAVAIGADRGDGARVGEALRVADGELLDPAILVVDESGEILGPPAPDGHLERIDGELGAQRTRHAPADDGAAEDVD